MHGRLAAIPRAILDQKPSQKPKWTVLDRRGKTAKLACNLTQ